ncbi:MAG: LysM peptidoglycan-binding domain-containing protein [Candidatus Aminicenantes bacterium]|nr:LysM peptidoglycan-binding domain-containing protein [Candidatus Aminicenantes bacterium]
MFNKSLRFIIGILICLLFSWGTKLPAGDKFPTPEILIDNVAFWKKIYKEISLKEGLLHDSEYPLVIYKKINTNGTRGRQRTSLLRKHFAAIRLTLKNINTKPEAKWSAEEKRIAGLFLQHAPAGKLKTAKSRLRFQQGQRERFIAGLERSGAYLDYIFSVFDRYEIPRIIAYLPHVESSFYPKAISKVGAAGLWQFMRSTGRLFLKIDYRVDERLDPYKATVAAAKLLRKNYRELKAWPLALTAYNHGLESIKRAVRQTGSRDLGVIIRDYKNRRFRFASKNFYSCFLATSEIAADVERHFPTLDYVQPINYNEVELDSFISMSALSEYLGISQQVLAALNPAVRPVMLRKNLTIPKGYVLRIPGSISPGQAKERIANIPAALKKKVEDIYHYYSVRRGDTLYRISRRFGVSIRTILMSNKIASKGRIYVGQVLKIPGRSRTKTVSSQTKKMKKTAPPPVAIQEKSARKTGPAPVRVNQTALKLPDPGKTVDPQGIKYGAAFDVTLYDLDIEFDSGRETARVTVSVGESLGHYADWLGVSTWKIKQLNRLGSKDIKIDQKILLPMSDDLLQQFVVKRLEYHMSLEEDFYTRFRVEEIKLRKVKYGETLWTICADASIPLWLFKKFNRRLNIEKVGANTTIKLPLIKEK